LALHHRPGEEQQAEQEARHALGLAGEAAIVRIVDEDALAGPSEAPAIVCAVSFGNVELGKLALAPSAQGEEDTVRLVELVARELGSPLRMAILMEQQQRLASVDPLTRLSNRRCFLERIGVEVARSHRYDTGLSVLLMDVDHFKAINDRHGHAAGDSVLSALGATLDQHVRACDVAARWGGEEFVVALPSTNLEGARGAAERMRALIEQVSVEHDGATIRFTVSVGAAELRPEETLAGLIDRADRAMYRAKTGGRNRVALEERRATPEPTPASGTSAEGLAS
jgi:diguanylate cyclase (GGDEF)-like protein